MVSIQLEPVDQKRLDDLAKRQGQDPEQLARRIVMDYLDFQSLPKDSDDEWAEASVALTPEIMNADSWDKHEHGS